MATNPNLSCGRARWRHSSFFLLQRGLRTRYGRSAGLLWRCLLRRAILFARGTRALGCGREPATRPSHMAGKSRHQRRNLTLRALLGPEPTSRITRTISVAAEPRIVAIVSRGCGPSQSDAFAGSSVNQKQIGFAPVNSFERFAHRSKGDYIVTRRLQRRAQVRARPSRPRRLQFFRA